MGSSGPLLREHRGIRLRLLGVLSLLVAGFTIDTLAVTGFVDPGPIRALWWNRQRMEDYIFRLYAGLISEREDGQGYCVPDLLADAGVRYVHRERGCVVIAFPSLPPDPVPVLIYSPDGWAGVPERYWPGHRDPRNSTWQVFDFRRIDDRWFYCRWDM
jgi:hypothetical protein